MLTSATSVIERRTRIDEDHSTHPYEAGWASEALFFVQAEGPHPDLTIQAQVSPDGLTWLDRGEAEILYANQTAIDIGLQGFGGWLRLLLRGAGVERPATILVHLALKG